MTRIFQLTKLEFFQIISQGRKPIPEHMRTSKREYWAFTNVWDETYFGLGSKKQCEDLISKG